MKFAGDSTQEGSVKAESFAFYTMVSALVLVPVAFAMTDFTADINWGFDGMYSAGLIQLLNAVGFLFFAYAIRYGKAIIVVPLMSLAPVVTVIISLIIYGVIPHIIIVIGMIIAFVSIYILSQE
jgi:drug/metabolite transporter (DMT)-like permease